jgi:hypothetical protein
MKRGDIILLEEMDEEFEDGWWLGQHPASGHKGLFPAGTFSTKYEKEKEKEQGRKRKSS